MINYPQLLANLQKEVKAEVADPKRLERLARIDELAKLYAGEDQVISFEQIAERIKANPEELKMMTGWSGLDAILRGVRLQQVVVVSALTKSGKTSLLMDLSSRWASYNPLWFPFEESGEELVRKFVERGEKPPHAYTPAMMSGNTLDWIETKIIESIAKYGTKVVFIDQLDFIIPYNSDNHALRIGEAMRTLKGIAKKWNIAIFLICHLVKANMDTQPTLQDLKGSSSIAQEADTVILLWREMKKMDGEVTITNNVNISVQANRRTGSTGNVKMIFRDGHFYEEEWRDMHLTDEQNDIWGGISKQ